MTNIHFVTRIAVIKQNVLQTQNQPFSHVSLIYFFLRLELRRSVLIKFYPLESKVLPSYSLVSYFPLQKSTLPGVNIL